MTKLHLPLLYRQILRAAQQFPSIKRDTIVQEIKTEFAANKVCTISTLQTRLDLPPSGRLEADGSKCSITAPAS